jgi:group II intron reverse transcriptase/maturase
MEQRKSLTNVNGKAQAGKTPVRHSTDVVSDDGLSRSSYETSVMEVERRAEVVQLELPLTTSEKRRKINATLTRVIPITKQMVWSAYKKVRQNKGAAGTDGITIAMYEEQLSANLYKLWNRLSSGSYFPPAVREVYIPKSDGKMRKLGIPTVNDRVAQEVTKSYLEPRLEKVFSEQSYGYRPQRNQHQAVEQVRKNTRKYAWVIDMDISSFFDSMSHEKLLLALKRHVTEKWVLLYSERWLKAPTMESTRKRGTPQGGVISPLFANLFLHYAFDKWFEKEFPNLSFVRYADDIIVHCETETKAKEIYKTISERLTDCELSLNEEKSKIVYCKNAHRKAQFKTIKFDFLGFCFKPKPTKNKATGRLFLSFDCAISRKSEIKISESIRESKFHQWTSSTIHEIANTFNDKIRGWINYYGKFRIHSLNRIFKLFNWRLIKWAVRKYKRFKGSMSQAANWIRRIAFDFPDIFVHWHYGFQRA